MHQLGDVSFLTTKTILDFFIESDNNHFITAKIQIRSKWKSIIIDKSFPTYSGRYHHDINIKTIPDFSIVDSIQYSNEHLLRILKSLERDTKNVMK